MLLGLTVGLFGFAMVWHAQVRSDPFRRGPLEGPVGLGTRAVTR